MMDMEISETELSFPKDKKFLQETSTTPCYVCGDRATGTHYGVIACFGCRGFFRRTLQGNAVYKCTRTTGNCSVTPKERKKCKHCRFQKCLNLGMKMKNEDVKKSKKSRTQCCESDPDMNSGDSLEAAQFDSDISSDTSSTLNSNVTSLVQTYHQTRHSLSEMFQFPGIDTSQIVDDKVIYALACRNKLHAEVWVLVEWAKKIPGFRELCVQDQISLLRSAVPRHIYLQWANEMAMIVSEMQHNKTKSSPYYCPHVVGEWKLEDPNIMSSRIFHELAMPIREEGIGEEIICFTALLLLDPNVKGLKDPGMVKDLRRNVQYSLEEEKKHLPNLTWKITDLYHLLSTLDSISWEGRKSLRASRFFEMYGKCPTLLLDIFF